MYNLRIKNFYDSIVNNRLLNVDFLVYNYKNKNTFSSYID